MYIPRESLWSFEESMGMFNCYPLMRHPEPESSIFHCSHCRLRAWVPFPLLISTMVKEIRTHAILWCRGSLTQAGRMLWTYPPFLHAPSSNGEDKWTDSGRAASQLLLQPAAKQATRAGIYSLGTEGALWKRQWNEHNQIACVLLCRSGINQFGSIIH